MGGDMCPLFGFFFFILCHSLNIILRMPCIYLSPKKDKSLPRGFFKIPKSKAGGIILVARQSCCQCWQQTLHQADKRVPGLGRICCGIVQADCWAWHICGAPGRREGWRDIANTQQRWERPSNNTKEKWTGWCCSSAFFSYKCFQNCRKLSKNHLLKIKIRHKNSQPWK